MQVSKKGCGCGGGEGSCVFRGRWWRSLPRWRGKGLLPARIVADCKQLGEWSGGRWPRPGELAVARGTFTPPTRHEPSGAVATTHPLSIESGESRCGNGPCRTDFHAGAPCTDQCTPGSDAGAACSSPGRQGPCRQSAAVGGLRTLLKLESIWKNSFKTYSVFDSSSSIVL